MSGPRQHTVQIDGENFIVSVEKGNSAFPYRARANFRGKSVKARGETESSALSKWQEDARNLAAKMPLRGQSFERMSEPVKASLARIIGGFAYILKWSVIFLGCFAGLLTIVIVFLNNGLPTGYSPAETYFIYFGLACICLGIVYMAWYVGGMKRSQERF